MYSNKMSDNKAGLYMIMNKTAGIIGIYQEKKERNKFSLHIPIVEMGIHL